MKAYTDIEQSKKLTEFLPIESADMLHCLSFDGDLLAIVPKQYSGSFRNQPELTIPCWSLAALLDVLPKGEYKDTDLCFGVYKGDKYRPEWVCSYEQQEPFIIKICCAANPIDACYKLILKLHEQKLL